MYVIQCGETFKSVPYNIDTTLYVKRCSNSIPDISYYPGKSLWALDKAISIGEAKKFSSYDGAEKYLSKIANSEGMFIVEV